MGETLTIASRSPSPSWVPFGAPPPPIVRRPTTMFDHELRTVVYLGICFAVLFSSDFTVTNMQVGQVSTSPTNRLHSLVSRNTFYNVAHFRDCK